MTIDTVSIQVYESAVKTRQMFRNAFRREREITKQLRQTLIEVRSKAICAGAAFVHGNEDREERCIEVLNLIDEAIDFNPDSTKDQHDD